MRGDVLVDALVDQALGLRFTGFRRAKILKTMGDWRLWISGWNNETFPDGQFSRNGWFDLLYWFYLICTIATVFHGGSCPNGKKCAWCGERWDGHRWQGLHMPDLTSIALTECLTGDEATMRVSEFAAQEPEHLAHWSSTPAWCVSTLTITNSAISNNLWQEGGFLVNLMVWWFDDVWWNISMREIEMDSKDLNSMDPPWGLPTLFKAWRPWNAWASLWQAWKCKIEDEYWGWRRCVPFTFVRRTLTLLQPGTSRCRIISYLPTNYNSTHSEDSCQIAHLASACGWGIGPFIPTCIAHTCPSSTQRGKLWLLYEFEIVI